MSRKLRELLDAGKLYELAVGCKRIEELAAKVGMSGETYAREARRLRAVGVAFPTWEQLHKGDVLSAAAIGDDLGNDFGDEEPTLPGVPDLDDDSADAQLAARRERSENTVLKTRLKAALDALEQCKLELATVNAVNDNLRGVDPIRPRETTSGIREATAVALASDWHIEERIDPASVNGVNEYNLEIARRRVERYFAGLSYLIRYHADHFAIRDLVLWLGGDLITGYLREENLEHNELSPVQAIATLHVWLIEGIQSVLNSTGIESLRIVCNSGNHGRLTEKVRPSTREANSIEWLLYASLARELAADSRVTVSLPHGSQTYLDVYDWTIRFTHGDEVKFGGGIGGMTVPLMKALARFETVRHADVTCLGHFHQLTFGNDFVVNGSLIGYSPYALSIGAKFERPKQAFFLMDNKRGKCMTADIWVDEEEERNVKARR